MSTNKDENVRVFINYAREDADAANRLYNDLKMAGLDPMARHQISTGRTELERYYKGGYKK
jgi:hypothetical protein